MQSKYYSNAIASTPLITPLVQYFTFRHCHNIRTFITFISKFYHFNGYLRIECTHVWLSFMNSSTIHPMAIKLWEVLLSILRLRILIYYILALATAFMHYRQCGCHRSQIIVFYKSKWKYPRNKNLMQSVLHYYYWMAEINIKAVPQ